MNKQVVAIIILLGLFLPVVASGATPQHERFHPHADVDFWVNALGNYNYYWDDIPAGYRISIDVDVTYGSDIDFYIFDEENYDLYISSQSSSAHDIRENVGSVSLTFTVPYSGEWHLIFNNDDWFFRRHIEGTITLVASTTSPSSLNGAIVGLAIAIIAIGIGVLCCKKLGNQNKKLDQGYHVPAQTSYSSPPIKQTQPVSYCPYCGTPKQLFDAKFCSKCGRALSGPDLEWDGP